MAFSHNKIHEESEWAWICHCASNWAVPIERWPVHLVPTWKAKHSRKSNPLSEHLLLHDLHSYFTFSPADYLSSKVCWIKFGFHLYPVREITLFSCRREQKWIQSGFTCVSVLQPWLSLLALSGIYFSLCEESVVWLKILLNKMMPVQGPALTTAIW